MEKSDQRVCKSNRVYLPSLDLSLSELRWSERRHLWWHLLPYLLEPQDKKKRNRLRALQCARLIDRHNKKLAKSNNSSRQQKITSRLKDYDLKKIEKLGGYERLRLSPSASDIKRVANQKTKDFATIHSLVSTFLRLSLHGEKVGSWPSIANSQKFQRRPKSDSDISKAAYKSKNKIEAIWPKYKESAHIIYGVLEAAQTPNIQNKKIIDTIASARARGEVSHDKTSVQSLQVLTYAAL